MNITRILKTLLIPISISLSIGSNAVIIEGTFGGTVTEAKDANDDDPAFVDVWDGNIVGQKITGSFWYDASKGPNFTHTDWVGLTFNVDGKVFDLSKDTPYNLPVTYRTNVVYIEDNDVGMGGTVANDRFLITSSLERGELGANVEEIESALLFSTEVLNTIKGEGLQQEFDLQAGDASPFSGHAFFNIFRRMDGELTYFSANIHLSDIQVKARSAAVPEPSTLFLLFGGLLGIVARRHVRK
jgi:hypothetical protein